MVVLNTRSVKTMPMGKDTVIADVGNAAEAVNADEEAANPLHEIQSLCMRCGKNVRLVGKPPMLFLDWFDMNMFDYF